MEAKQSNVLKKLEELRKDLLSMRTVFNSMPLEFEKKIVKTTIIPSMDVVSLSDVVITAHPENVPFSIIAFKKLCYQKHCLNVMVDVFMHSTLNQSDLSRDTSEFVKKVMLPVKLHNCPTLKITIIFKDVDSQMMLTSPFVVPVFGEVNIIRYLNRIGPAELRYENDFSQSTLTDAVLDVCYQLSRSLIRDRINFIRILCQKLSTSKSLFFNDSLCLSVADIAVVVVLKKLFQTFEDLPLTLREYIVKLAPEFV